MQQRRTAGAVGRLLAVGLVLGGLTACTAQTAEEGGPVRVNGQEVTGSEADRVRSELEADQREFAPEQSEDGS